MPDRAEEKHAQLRVVVLGQFGGFAKGVGSRPLRNFLNARGNEAVIVDAYHRNRAATKGDWVSYVSDCRTACCEQT